MICIRNSSLVFLPELQLMPLKVAGWNASKPPRRRTESPTSLAWSVPLCTATPLAYRECHRGAHKRDRSNLNVDADAISNVGVCRQQKSRREPHCGYGEPVLVSAVFNCLPATSALKKKWIEPQWLFIYREAVSIYYYFVPEQASRVLTSIRISMNQLFPWRYGTQKRK